LWQFNLGIRVQFLVVAHNLKRQMQHSYCCPNRKWFDELSAAAGRMDRSVRLHLITAGRVGANGFVVAVTWGVAQAGMKARRWRCPSSPA